MIWSGGSKSTRWPDEVDSSGREYGTPIAYLEELCRYWREQFDWRAAERKLDDLDHYTTTIDDQLVHFVYARAGRDDAIPLIATHGWPSTFFELLKLVPRLTASTDEGTCLRFSSSPRCKRCHFVATALAAFTPQTTKAPH